MFARRVTHALASNDLADRIRSIALVLIAMAAFVQAGFTVNRTVGWAVLGAGLLVVDWLLGDDEDDDRPPSSMQSVR